MAPEKSTAATKVATISDTATKQKPLVGSATLAPSTRKRKAETPPDGDIRTRERQQEESDRKSTSPINSQGTEMSAELDFDEELPDFEKLDEVVSYFIDLPPLPTRVPRTPPLSVTELAELEKVLELGEADSWRDDWAGNLAFADKEIANPKVRQREKQQSFRQSLLEWAHSNPENGRYIWNLIRQIMHMKGAPEAAKRVLGNVDSNSVVEMEKAIRRASYDPTVLRQDGWTTRKSADWQGASGGTFLIGSRIRWENSDAVVIAYVHDIDIGDLWKAVWVGADGHDFITFDLEAEELMEAKRKWERRQKKVISSRPQNDVSRRSSRFVVSSDFTVKGIESGIVLAASYSKGARRGVFWPARVMHASESHVTTGKRTSSKQKVDLVFLAPYWTPDEPGARVRRVESLSETGVHLFNSGPLLHIETVDATEEMIKEYPYDENDGVNPRQLMTAFRFTGLPRAVFPRFLDGHRLALALKKYAADNIKSEVTAMSQASAGLFETHPMAIHAPTFPSVVLNLPLGYILSQLSNPTDDKLSSASDNGDTYFEPVINLSGIVNAMKPPNCFGASTENAIEINHAPPRSKRMETSTVEVWREALKVDNGVENSELSHHQYFNDLNHLQSFFASTCPKNSPTIGLLRKVFGLISDMTKFEKELGQSRRVENGVKIRCRNLLQCWAILKCSGEDSIAFAADDFPDLHVIPEWRRLCERIYKHFVSVLPGTGSIVLTDFRCNGHLVSDTCFERSVRLPAAMRGARIAGATTDGHIKLITEIHGRYLDLVEQQLLSKVHTAAYLKRMKSRCSSARDDSEVVKLTDDSDGQGGEDTSTY